ncbi:hypothetical protein AN216_15875 [Streptomyces oceani]|uniref:Lipoprotein n=1 Tax=Streptomyces oceani TaxID=1075402 RepID=A0A1E7KG66_9ACTN|nr:hypothetical protein AN216_15875 [Streptomyces oceani]
MVAALVVGVSACGGGSEEEDDSKSSSGSEEKQADKGPSVLVKKANKAMAETSFRASGSTTAFPGARQVMRWDPEQGMHMKVEGDEGDEVREAYCKEGTSYISTSLLAASVSKQGQKVTIPDELGSSFVEQQGQGCEMYFKVPDSAKRAPGKDTTVDGEKTKAVTVKGGKSADVYRIAASGQARVLQMESKRNGQSSKSTYEGFGESYDITLPPEDQRISMEEFQKQVKQ